MGKGSGRNLPTPHLPPRRRVVANPCHALGRRIEMLIQLLLYMAPVSPPRFLEKQQLWGLNLKLVGLGGQQPLWVTAFEQIRHVQLGAEAENRLPPALTSSSFIEQPHKIYPLLSPSSLLNITTQCNPFKSGNQWYL